MHFMWTTLEVCAEVVASAECSCQVCKRGSTVGSCATGFTSTALTASEQLGQSQDVGTGVKALNHLGS